MRKPVVTRRRILAAATVAAGAAVAGGLAIPRLLSSRSGRNILFIIADTFRADRIARRQAIDGTAQSITPVLDRLANEGLYFPNAVSPSSFTPISMLGILYNEDPTRCRGGFRAPEIETPNLHLATRLKGLGYSTALVSANDHYAAECLRRDYEQAFIHETRPTFKSAGTRNAERSSPVMNEKALAMLAEAPRDRPFFLQVHYMDNHEPYYCPGAVVQRFGRRWHAVVPQALHDGLVAGQGDYLMAGERVAMKDALVRLAENYDESVYFLDSQVGALLEGLDRMGALDDTLVVFTADHGEEFADNVETTPGVGHGRNLSQPEIHVPVIVWRKGMKAAGTAAPGTVSNGAVVNAIMDDYARTGAVGAAGDYAGGRGIVSALRWRRRFDGFSYVEGAFKVTGRFGEGQAVEGIAAFALGRDCSASAADAGGVPEALLARMRQRLAGADGGAAIDEERMSEEQRARFRGLGYLE